MRSFAFALLAATVAASPALAQEGAPFTGPRVEGLVGWDRVQGDGARADEVTYGLAAGYDMQMGFGLVGADVEFMDSDTRSCEGAATVADPRLCAKAARDLYVGGRIGTVVGDRALLYAKLGYTNARFKLTADDGTVEESFGSTDFDGIRAGVGAEYAVGPNSFVKAEYRYSNYEDGLARHQALGGFGFRF